MAVNKTWTGALIALALCPAAPAQGQEILLTGPLAGAPGGGRRLWRERRLAIAPAIGAQIGANDNPSWLWGGELLFYPWDRLGGGFFASGASPIVDRRPNELRGVLGPELVVVPWAGKTGAFLSYVPYDLHLHAGAARVIEQKDGVTPTAWAPMLGGGVTAFSASCCSFALDYRILTGDPLRHTLMLSFGFWLFDRHWDDE